MIDLFGDKAIEFPKPSRSKSRTLFSDYEGFMDKFQPKKTTDDCYTPEDVYECVLNYVHEKTDMSGVKSILRPFYPGGDFRNAEYPSNCAVIDNPPFSIISEITRFYTEHGVRFFLFAPHLTLFSSDQDLTAIVCGVDIVYENDACVKTSFLTNMMGDVRVVGEPELYDRLTAISKKNAVNLPKYQYPQNVLTVSMVHAFVHRGIRIEFDKKSLAFCRGLDSQKKYKKAIFGSGFLMSEKAAAEKAAAEKAAAEKAAAEKANTIEWELSPREIEIIKSLK